MDYSVETIKELEREIEAVALHRPARTKRYEPGTELEYDVTGVADGRKARVRLVVEKFVGGGFAGQVYRVLVLEIEPGGEPVGGLETGNFYAMKILIPPSGFSRFFRNALYWIGFQGAFQLQTNPAATRSGALWQKFIRRGAKIWFSSERVVTDIHATFVDSRLGSCGELSEWIDGRTWRLEVDQRRDLLKKWKQGKRVDEEKLGSPEYRAKYVFMHRFVELLHRMGGHEFARQYEWSTCKSQPNCLKRSETEDSPGEGLVAVDFRTGLALLPFLPMSPGDFKLILTGLGRGSLVQFDRGDIEKLEKFVEEHREEFSGMSGLLAELKEADRIYRDSIPDITHNHMRLISSPRLWSTILVGAAKGWRIKNLVDDGGLDRLLRNRALTGVFYLAGILPFLGRFFKRFWGHAGWRRHYTGMLSSRQYLGRAVRARIIESLIRWHRSRRISSDRAGLLSRRMWRCLYHLPLSGLPAGLHRFLTDWDYAKEKLIYLSVRPVRLYFNAELREEWLRDMVEEGRNRHLLLEKDAEVILSQIKEPFIQKYLKSLAVHVCTLPVTQLVSVAIAIIYILTHPEMPRAQAYAIGIGIIALFQVTPISPGSLVRGGYVLQLVIRERNFKDYNIAVFLAFFKYIGYLAFPIQMSYRYPALARFMAGYWATEAVHIVPVFGERGALLEHYVFSLFYNLPLTIRRRMRKRVEMRAVLEPRYWHISLCALAGTVLFGLVDYFYLSRLGEMPGLGDIYAAVVFIPAACGAVVTLGAGGAPIWQRIVGGSVCGAAMGIIYTAVSLLIGREVPAAGSWSIASMGLWRVFIFSLLATAGVIMTEMKLPESDED